MTLNRIHDRSTTYPTNSATLNRSTPKTEKENLQGIIQFCVREFASTEDQRKALQASLTKNPPNPKQFYELSIQFKDSSISGIGQVVRAHSFLTQLPNLLHFNTRMAKLLENDMKKNGVGLWDSVCHENGSKDGTFLVDSRAAQPFTRELHNYHDMASLALRCETHHELDDKSFEQLKLQKELISTNSLSDNDVRQYHQDTPHLDKNVEMLGQPIRGNFKVQKIRKNGAEYVVKNLLLQHQVYASIFAQNGAKKLTGLAVPNPEVHLVKQEDGRYVLAKVSEFKPEFKDFRNAENISIVGALYQKSAQGDEARAYIETKLQQHIESNPQSFVNLVAFMLVYADVNALGATFDNLQINEKDEILIRDANSATFFRSSSRLKDGDFETMYNPDPTQDLQRLRDVIKPASILIRLITTYLQRNPSIKQDVLAKTQVELRKMSDGLIEDDSMQAKINPDLSHLAIATTQKRIEWLMGNLDTVFA
jgi:hypothetical protein